MSRTTNFQTFAETTGPAAPPYSIPEFTEHPETAQDLFHRMRAKIIEEEAGAILERLRGSTNGHAPKAAAEPASKPPKRAYRRSKAGRARQIAAMKAHWKRRRAAKASKAK